MSLYPVAARLLDYNSDGFTDVAVIGGKDDAMLLIFRGNDDGELTLSWATWCGDAPVDLEIADLNGDALADIVIALKDEHLLRCFLGDAQGRFRPCGEVYAGSSPSGLLATDLDGDGKDEMLLRSADRLFIYESTPEGSLAELSRYLLLATPSGLSAGDFNQDSFTDVVLSYETQGAYIFFGEGNGRVSSGVRLEEEVNDLGDILGLEAADIDQDGSVDLLIHGSTGGRYHILWGNGNGTFLKGPVIEPVASPSFPVITSVDDHGLLDVLSVAPEAGAVEVYCGIVCGAAEEGVFPQADGFSGHGRGGLARCFVKEGGLHQCGNGTVWAGASDMDGDGIIDLCVLNRESGSLSLFFGEGGGVFQAAPAFDAGPGTAGAKSIVVLDANEDGYDDAAVSFRWENEVSILLGDGRGRLTPHAGFFSGGLGTHTLATADMNEDGHSDILVRNVVSSSVSVLLGDGSGDFVLAGEFPTDTGTHFVTVVDLDQDGHKDVVTPNSSGGTVSILLGDGTGHLEHISDVPVGAGPHSSTVIDYDRNGVPDIATANTQEDSVAVLENISGTLVLVAKIPVGTGPISITSGDFDEDGFPDLATADFEGFTMSILLGNGTPSFRSPGREIFSGNGPHFVVTVDADFDGHLDLVSPVTGMDAVVVHYGDGEGGFPRSEFLGVGNNPNAVSVGDFNSDGKPDVVTANVLSNTVSLLLNATPAIRPPHPRGY